MSRSETCLRLRRNDKARVLQGHPWVYQSELEFLPDESFFGQALPLEDSRKRFLGTGIYNGRSQIAWRRISRQHCALDAAFIDGAVAAAIARRAPEPCQRLIWSEADHLPGLVVDRFEDVLVVQVLTLAMDRAQPYIIDALRRRLSPVEIVLRNDAPSRLHEGMDSFSGTASGKPFPPREFTIDGIRYELDLVGGQKTGFFLDQRAQHLRVAAMAKGRKVLDGCCHLGGFALQSAKAGATSVTGVDISSDAIAAARATAKRNGLKVDFQEANLFDWLRAHESERYGLIVIDPPSFARNKRAIGGALRGYKELNLRALKMLDPGGILATYSCSAAIDEPGFQQVVAEAAADAHRECVVREQTGQPADHPVLLGMPESRYLKGLILEVL